MSLHVLPTKSLLSELYATGCFSVSSYWAGFSTNVPPFALYKLCITTFILLLAAKQECIKMAYSHIQINWANTVLCQLGKPTEETMI